MNVLAFNGSPRRNGNTSILVHELLRGARDSGADTEEIVAGTLNLHYCRGCLRCNLLRRCAIKGDDWESASQKILDADALIFASPIYFHHLSAPLKKLLDRFRSFINVQITEQGLLHTPWHRWRKHFVLLLCLGSSAEDDALPVIDLFTFMTKILGPENRLTSILGTRLAVVHQVAMDREELSRLYARLHLPLSRAKQDYQRNHKLMENCFKLGKSLAS